MRLTLTLSLASIASLAACSSGTSGAPNSPFQGSWACDVTEVLTITTPPGSKTETITTSPHLTIVADAGGNITSTSVSDAGASCPVKLTTLGSTATIVPGQTCDAGGLSLKYAEGGTASVNGSTLTASLSYSFTGTVAVAVDGGTTTSVTVAGTGTSSYNCTKSGA